MRIRYENTRWDLIRGQWQMLRFNRALHYLLIAIGAFVLYSSFSYSEIQHKSLVYRAFYAGFYLLFVLGAGALGALAVAALNTLLGNGKGLIGEHRLTLTEEGLEESTAFNRSLNKWAGIRGLKETSSLYLLFVTENNAHLVPKKKPLLEGDLGTFIDEFRKRIEDASHATAANAGHTSDQR